MLRVRKKIRIRQLPDPKVFWKIQEEEEPDVGPTQQLSTMRRIVERRNLNEPVDDDVPNLEEVFREEAELEPDRIPAEVPPDDNRLEAPVFAGKQTAEQPLHEPEPLVRDQPTGFPEPRELTAFSPDTGPARRPKWEYHPVILMASDKYLVEMRGGATTH